MKRFFTSILIAIFSFFVFSANNVSAEIITKQEGNIIIEKTEIINDDLFIGAQMVNIDGVVNGDVFVGAQTVTITGTINGNLHVGTNTLNLNGVVTGNIYVGGQNISVNNSTINGSLLSGGATVNVENSIIDGSILAGAGVLNINSQVGRSVYAGTGSLTIGDNTNIGKDLYYTADKQGKNVNISKNAIISGTTYKSEVKTTPKFDSKNMNKLTPVFHGVKLFSSILSFISALIIGFLYFKFFNKHFTQTVKILSKSFWKSFGIGFLVMIAFIPGLIILLVTVVGIPLAGLLFLTLLFYIYLSKIIVGASFGNLISQKFNWKFSTYASFVLGLFVIYIFKFIPFIGFLAGLIVLWLGLGALTIRTFSKSS